VQSTLLQQFSAGSTRKTRQSDAATVAAPCAATPAAAADDEDDPDVVVTGAVIQPWSKRAKGDRDVASAAASFASAAAAAAAASTSVAAAASAVAAPTPAESSRSRLEWRYFPSVIPSAAERSRLYGELVKLVNPVPGKIFVYGAEHTERRLTGAYARHAGGFKYSGAVKALSGEWPPVLEELHQIAAHVAEKFARDTGVDLGLPSEPPADNSAGRTSEGKGNEEAAVSAVVPAAASSSSVPAAATAAAASVTAAACASLPYWDTVLINYYRDGSDCISWHSDKDGAGATIASFSLGAEREFLIRRRPPRGQGKSTSSKSLEQHKLPLGDGSLLLMLPGMQEHWHHSVPPRKGMPRGRINVTFRAHNRQQSAQPQIVRS